MSRGFPSDVLTRTDGEFLGDGMNVEGNWIGWSCGEDWNCKGLVFLSELCCLGLSSGFGCMQHSMPAICCGEVCSCSDCVTYCEVRLVWDWCGGQCSDVARLAADGFTCGDLLSCRSSCCVLACVLSDSTPAIGGGEMSAVSRVCWGRLDHRACT